MTVEKLADASPPIWHVQPRTKGGWEVRADGSRSCVAACATREEALEAVRSITATLPEARVLIHRTRWEVEREWVKPTSIGS